MMILISVPTNGHPERVYEQITAYNQAMGGDCLHVVHVSRDAVQKGLMQIGPDISGIENVLINDRSYYSRTPSILGVHLMNVEFALRRGLTFDHVYLHTASDLPYRPNLNVQVRAFDIGLGPTKRVDLNRNTGWFPAVADHLAIRNLVAHFGPNSDIFTTRSEGFFCRRDIFFEIMWFAMTHIRFDTEELWRGNYPYEEYVLPTVVEHLFPDASRTRHAVATTTSMSEFGLPARAPVTADHIPMLEALPPEVFAFKFAPDMDSPVRHWVRSRLGYSMNV